MAVQTVELKATPRTGIGSRAVKRLRDAGQVPGVLYGHKQAVVPFTVDKHDLAAVLNRHAHVVDLMLETGTEKVLVKDVQYDHLGDEVIHIDLTRVSLDERVEVTIPIELKGTPKGEADGGVLQQIISEIEVECLVLEIPELIRHNVSDMALDAVLHVKDLQVPAGVKLLRDPEAIVAQVKEIKEEVSAAEAVTAEPEIIGRKAGEEEGEEAKK
jgi:large subunit ribosomal protein L25